MRKHVAVIVLIFTMLTLVLVPTVFAQTSTCVITDKQGSLATINCPGQGTTVQNLGGQADIYKIGDTITVDNLAGAQRGGASTNPASNVDPRNAVRPGQR